MCFFCRLLQKLKFLFKVCSNVKKKKINVFKFMYLYPSSSILLLSFWKGGNPTDDLKVN